MFHDIVHDTPQIREMAKKLGVTPHFLGDQVSIVSTIDKQKAKKYKTQLLYLANDKVRSVIEQKCVDYISGFENIEPKDHTHYRKSGMNQVIAKLLKKNDIAYLIDFSQLQQAVKHGDTVWIGRLMQNIALQKKFGFPAKVATLAKEPYQLRPAKQVISTLVALGATPEQAKSLSSYFRSS